MDEEKIANILGSNKTVPTNIKAEGPLTYLLLIKEMNTHIAIKKESFDSD